MNAARIVQPYIDKARNDLQAARQDAVSLWGRSDTDTLGALIDVRDILESLTRACASLAKGLEQLSHVTSVTYDESDDEEPETEDEQLYRTTPHLNPATGWHHLESGTSPSEAIDEAQDLEPDIDDEPPPDYGPPGSGAVITEWP